MQRLPGVPADVDADFVHQSERAHRHAELLRGGVDGLGGERERAGTGGEGAGEDAGGTPPLPDLGATEPWMYPGAALDAVRAKGQVLARERSAKRALLASVRSPGEEARVRATKEA